MKKNLSTLIAIIGMALCLQSCEKPLIENPTSSSGDKVKLTLNVTRFEQIPFNDLKDASRATTDMSSVCTRINVAVFSNDEKTKSVNQEVGDADFGKVSMELPKGTYKLVVLAHSCNGNATISLPTKITFPNNKVTDTFYYCADIDVTESSSLNLDLKRAVAMFRLVVTDPTPADVDGMRLYYTGGSSTFDAVAGFGCVQSKQYEDYTVTDAMHSAGSQFDIYSFPHEASDKLRIIISGSQTGVGILHEQILEEVPIKINQITKYTTPFFSKSEETNTSDITFTTSDTWTEINYTN